MTNETPIWAGPGRLPTAHVVRAAIHVAAMIDSRGSRVVDARESYWHRATGGLFAPPDLRLGERLLVDCRLVEERELTLYPLPELEQILDGAFDDAVVAICARAAEIAAAEGQPPVEDLEREIVGLIPDPEKREEFLIALGRRFDDAQRRLLGAIGEEVVVAALRSELNLLGYPELARAVRHVSLETDQAGYDISAPRIGGAKRLIEVKATTSGPGDVVFHLSRKEAETGMHYGDWSLVVCRVIDIERRQAQVIGWQAAAQLAPALPADSPGGHWETAAITVSESDLIPGLPSAVG